VIAAAVADAMGAADAVTDLPITPQRVKEILDRQGRG
jgi:CO/xanthine dehydrogenase Mo-binding subunit